MARPRRRIRSTAGVFATLGLLSLGVTGVAGAGPETEFVDGSGTARAQLARFAPRTGGLSYAVSTGVALASYEGTVAKAQAQTLDLGLFGLLATTVSPCGREPLLQPDQLPQPLRANSASGPPAADRQTAGAGPAAWGREAAKAEPGAASSAEATATRAELPGAVRIDVGAAEATTRLLPGQGRQAHAATSIGSVILAGGAVELRGLRWEVTQHTGEAPVGLGRFSIDQVMVGGQPLPSAGTTAADADAAVAAAQAALGVLGMSLEPPTVTTAEDGTVAVSPLRIRIGGPTAISEPAGDLLAQTQPAREALGDALAGDPEDCQDPRGAALKPSSDASLLLADIALAGVTGTGGIDVELGGVRAMTEGTAYDNPFGGPGLPPPLRATPPPVPKRTSAQDAPRPDVALAAPSSPRPVSAASGPAASPAPPPSHDGAAVPDPEVIVEEATPVTQRTSARCTTRHPLGRPACTHGAGLVAGAGGLVVALGLFAGDAVLARRRTDSEVQA